MIKNFIPALTALVQSGLSLVFLSIPAGAAPTTYIFEQTSSTVASFHVSASITINGGFADLPNITNVGNSGPYNFGDLLGLDFLGPRDYSLYDFTAEQSIVNPNPAWNISPNFIFFIDARDENDFSMNFVTDQIGFDSDDFSTGCGETGECVATGNWVPEPSPQRSPCLVRV